MLRSAEGWLAQPDYLGIVVMDPDGWDRANFDASWAEEIIEEEFIERLNQCTCKWTNSLYAKAPTCL